MNASSRFSMKFKGQVNHFWPSHLQILMQLLSFVCLDMDVNYAYYQINNFNGLRLNTTELCKSFYRVMKGLKMKLVEGLLYK